MQPPAVSSTTFDAALGPRRSGGHAAQMHAEVAGVFVGEWLFVFPLCGFSLSLFCDYAEVAAACQKNETQSNITPDPRGHRPQRP